MYIHKNIKYLRKSTGMSQSDLSKEIGVVPNQVGKYERGESDPPLDKITQIAELFNISVGDLVEKDLSQERNEKRSKEKQNTLSEEDAFERLYKKLEEKTIAVAKSGITVEQLIVIGDKLRKKHPQSAVWKEWDAILEQYNHK